MQSTHQINNFHKGGKWSLLLGILLLRKHYCREIFRKFVGFFTGVACLVKYNQPKEFSVRKMMVQTGDFESSINLYFLILGFEYFKKIFRECQQLQSNRITKFQFPKPYRFRNLVISE